MRKHIGLPLALLPFVLTAAESRPEDKPPAPKPAPPPPAPAKPPSYEDQRAPDDPWRLMDLGRAAFSRQEYGQAAWRFRQATEVAPNLPLAYFLLAQAEFALGKH